MVKKGRKKINKKILNLFKIVGYFSFAVILFFCYFLFQLDLLPLHYFLIVAVVLLLFDILSIIMIQLFKKPFKILGFLFSFLFIVIGLAGCYFIYHTNEFLNSSFRNGKLQSTTKYYVVTLNNESVNSLDDLNDTLSYLSEAYLIEEALGSLQSKKNISTKAYDDALSLFQDLKNQVISSVLVEQTSFNLVLDMKVGFLKEDFQIIYEFDVSVEEEQNAKSLNTSKYNIYIGGNDFTNSLMDFNMIVTVNTETHRVLLTSIPRDYYIPVVGHNGKRDTLSFMGTRGLEQNRRSLEEFLGFDLNYYMKINTKSLVGIVDAVGGIEYCSNVSYTTTHATILDSYDDSKGSKLYVQKGCQRLNGIEALTVARERLAFPDGDRQRQKNCQEIIIAIFKQLVSTNTITNYNNILNSLSDLYQTNIPRDVISDLIKETIDGAQWQFDNQSLNGTDGQGYVYLSNLTSYVMNPNMNSVSAAQAKIQEVLDSK